jgi:hypothetical protein
VGYIQAAIRLAHNCTGLEASVGRTKLCATGEACGIVDSLRLSSKSDRCSKKKGWSHSSRDIASVCDGARDRNSCDEERGAHATFFAFASEL